MAPMVVQVEGRRITHMHTGPLFMHLGFKVEVAHWVMVAPGHWEFARRSQLCRRIVSRVLVSLSREALTYMKVTHRC